MGNREDYPYEKSPLGGALKTDFWLVNIAFIKNVPPFKSLV